MGQTALVAERERLGAELVKALDGQKDLTLEAAFWARDDDEDWRLYLAAPEVADLGRRWGYEVVQRVLKTLNSSAIQASDLVVTSPDERLVAALRRAVQTGPGIYRIAFTQNTIDGVFVEEAVIYRLTTAGALRAVSGTSDGLSREEADALAFFESKGIGEPYWHYAIHPTDYAENRVSSDRDLKDFIIKASVSLRIRGWDFPHLGHGEPRSMSFGVEGATDSRYHVEAFRFYRSGFFIWRRILQEVRESGLENHVMFRGTIYTFAEKLQFAARMAEQLFTDSVSFSIAAAGLRDRSLWDDRNAVPKDMFTARTDRWERNFELESSRVVSDWRELSVDAASDFFSNVFGFDSNQGDVVRYWQDKILEGEASA